MKNLTNKNKRLSKQKIILFFILILSIFILFILIGVFKNDEKEVIENENQYVYSNDTSYSNVFEVLNKLHIDNSELSKKNELNKNLIITPPLVANQLGKSQFKQQLVNDDNKVNCSPTFPEQLKINLPDKVKNQNDHELGWTYAKSLVYSAKSDTQKNEISITNDSKTNHIEEKSSSNSNFFENKFKDLSGDHDNNSSDIILQQSNFELKAGSVIPATMINGVNSDLPGEVIAMVRDNVYDSINRAYLLIPQGSKLVGLYDNNIIYGQQRVIVIWNKLIYPNGDYSNLKAMPGTDLNGYSGFYDLVDNKYWKIFGSSFIIGVISAGMQYSQNNTNSNVQIGGNGIITNTSPTVGQTLAGSLGQQLGQTGIMITQKNLNTQPTITIRSGYQFNVMITADMLLKPYTIAN